VTFTPLKRGAPLPYKLLAGVEPCVGGWLVVTAKLVGISMFPDPAEVVATLNEVLDHRPSYSSVALHSTVGLPTARMRGGRTCDREARQLLGSRRGAAVVSPPVRAAIDDIDGSGLSAVVRTLLPRIREVHRNVASYQQKVVYEVHPELGFYQLNDDVPLRYGKRTRAGTEERLAIIRGRIPGADRVIEHRPPGISLPRLLDALADLWTARRIVARAITRLPDTPEWNEDGLKMELVR
jgi:predicted RNase H-like nuclease